MLSIADYLQSLRDRLAAASTPVEIAEALVPLAFAELRIDLHEHANAHLNALLAMSEHDPNAYFLTLSAHMQGAFDFYDGRTTSCVSHWLRARRSARLAKAQRLEAWIVAVLSTPLAWMGAHSEAFNYATEGLALATTTGDERAILSARLSLALIYIERGDGYKAVREIDAATPALVALQDPISVIWMETVRMDALVVIARELMIKPSERAIADVHEYTTACAAVAQAADQAGYAKASLFCWRHLAELQMLGGDSAAALATIDTAIARAEARQFPDNLAAVLCAKGSYLLRESRTAEGLAVLERARAYALEANHLGAQALINSERVAAYEKTGNLAAALDAAKEHARCLAQQRWSERANLDELTVLKRKFADLEQAQRTASLKRVTG
jgi:tetratricopeptide (TPR) repeat protein